MLGSPARLLPEEVPPRQLGGLGGVPWLCDPASRRVCPCSVCGSMTHTASEARSKVLRTEPENFFLRPSREGRPDGPPLLVVLRVTRRCRSSARSSDRSGSS